MLSIGLMSGTSMDGIDAALIETDGLASVKELGDLSLAYDVEMQILLKTAESAVRHRSGNMTAAKKQYPQALKDYLKNELGLSDNLISEKVKALSQYFHRNSDTPVTFDQIIERSTMLHANVVKQLLSKTNHQPEEVDVIGYHGQTLFHRPTEKITIQIGDGKLLAEETGITVVNDFRTRDVMSGGQGAPFAPLYHQALAIRDKTFPVAVVNCGGIANITVISGKNITDVTGFDTGPGNGLIDRYIKQKTHGKEQMDHNGQYGLKGKTHPDTLKLLYAHSIQNQSGNFFVQPAPKSLDIGELTLIQALDKLSIEDACRTLEAFTADTIVNSIDTLQGVIPTLWILAGGGWNNPVIRQELDERLKAKLGSQIQIKTADEAGWNGRALEAQIFAYLAVRSLQGLPISTPKTTRVPEPLSGGKIHLASRGTTKQVAQWLTVHPEVCPK